MPGLSEAQDLLEKLKVLSCGLVAVCQLGRMWCKCFQYKIKHLLVLTNCLQHRPLCLRVKVQREDPS